MLAWSIFNNFFIITASFAGGALLSVPLGHLMTSKNDSFALLLPVPKFDETGSNVGHRGLLDFNTTEKPSIASSMELSSQTWKDVPGKLEDRNRPLPLPSRGKANAAEDMKAVAATAFRIYTDEVDQKQSIGVCRFPASCVDTQGVLYVPQALKKFRTSIASKCALSKERMSFYDPIGDKEMKDIALTRHHPDTDIVGNLRPLRYHMPHLVEDLLKSIFTVAPYLQQPPSSKPLQRTDPGYQLRNTTVYCFETGSEGMVNLPNACSSNPPKRLGVLVEERAARINWTAGLFELLGSASSRAPLQLIYDSNAFAPYPAMNKEQQMHDNFLRKESNGRRSMFKPRRACFKSISIPGVSPWRFRKQGDILNNVLLQHSGIQQSLPTIPPSHRCTLNVTIINRPRREEDKAPWGAEPRRIVNIEELEMSLHKQAEGLGFSIVVETVDDFGALSFEEQVEVMQSTQSLISIHGAELSNSIFLRKGAAVVEIYPFRYTPSIFANMMKSFGLLHKMIIAEPDVDYYKRCMFYHNKPGSPSWKATEKNIDIFEARAKIFRAAKIKGHRGNYQAFGSFWDTSNIIKMVRPCGRGQRLHVDVPLVVRAALVHGEALCYGADKNNNKV